MRTSRWGATLGGLLWVGCAHEQHHFTDVGAVVAEVRADEVAASYKYREDAVSIHGQIVDKGLKANKEAVLEGVGANGSLAGAKVVTQNKNSVYIVLGPESGQGGQAICLFDDEQGEQIAPIKKGTPVNLTCRFSMVVGEKTSRKPVFYSCYLDG